jgi:hypothetical protein
MSEQDVQDAAATIARIGRSCDELCDFGFPELAHALAQATRQRRGRVKAHVFPARLAASLMDLADEAEGLVARLKAPTTVTIGIDVGLPIGEQLARQNAHYRDHPRIPATADEDDITPEDLADQARRERRLPAATDDLRVLTGGAVSETIARTAALGRSIRHVTHDVSPAGESLLIEFMGTGDESMPRRAALGIDAPRDRPGVLLCTWIAGEALAVMEARRDG